MCSASDSAVVRAKFMPDVRGVDRYKYFHRPVILESQNFVGSIDKKTSPRELPQIDLKPGEIIRISAHVNGNVNGRINGPVDGHLFEIKKTKKKNGLSTEYVLPQLDAKKCLATKKEPLRLSPRNITNASDLGRLRLILTTEQRKNVANNSTHNSSIRPKTQSSQTRVHKNGASGRTHAVKPSSSNGNLRIRRSQTLERLPRARSVHNVHGRGMVSVSAPASETSETSVKTITTQTSNMHTSGTQTAMEMREVPSPDGRISSSSAQTIECREFGTQTEDEAKDDSVHRSLEKIESYDSNATQYSSTSQKAIQTEQIPFIDHINRRFSKNDAEIEQRAELFAIIDAALDETIDKHSRLRAHRFIAGSARKQAQIWKDAKEFVSGVLIPSSIAEYNFRTHSS